MSNEIVKQEGSGPLSAVALREQVNLIQAIMREVMQGPSKENPEGVHYGIIPGCKKPSLLKPGAEKLSLTFRLRPIINESDITYADLGNGHRDVKVFCHILNSSGQELSTGVGSCSTMEGKYRYRGGAKKPTGQPVPTEYWNLKKAGKIQEAQELIGGEGFGPAKIKGKWEICTIGEKMENPDIADQYNTVLKMAKKRAYIDGILSATAASDIFTQDVEDMNLPESTETATAETPHQSPQRKSAEATDATTQPTTTEPPSEKGTRVHTATGVISAFYPRKGKGPITIKVTGYKEYFQTFDDNFGQILENYKDGESVTINYHTEIKGKYTNHIIDNIATEYVPS